MNCLCLETKITWEEQIVKYCHKKAEECAREEEMWIDAAVRADKHLQRLVKAYTE